VKAFDKELKFIQAAVLDAMTGLTAIVVLMPKVKKSLTNRLLMQ